MVEPARGQTEQLSFSARAVRSLAWRAASRIGPSDAAGLVAHLILERGAFAHLDDRQIALLAKALSDDGFFASRLIARAPLELATEIAAEQFIVRRAATRLQAETRDKLAAALSVAGLTRDIFDKLPDAGAADLALERIVSRDLLPQASAEVAAKTTSYLAGLSGFAAELLAAVPDAEVADLAFAQVLDRKLSTFLHPPEAERLAAELGTLPAFTPTLLLHVSDKPAQTDLVVAALNTWPGLGEAMLQSMPDGEVAGLAARQLLSRQLFEQVSAEENEELAERALSTTSFAAAVRRKVCEPAFAGAAAAMVEDLAAARPELVDRALRKMQPEFEHRADSYSQEGEDLILARLFDQPTGFYVDVGALHPIRFSNTYLLYRRGWRGINIDGTPGSMEEFRRLRPRDINVEALVCNTPGEATFHVFNEPALNTLSSALALQRTRENPKYRVVETVSLSSRRLSDLLQEHTPQGVAIDYFTIDVEGADLDVLKSNDWKRFRPRIVIAELLHTNLESLPAHEISRFLAHQGYQPIAKQYNSVFFRCADAASAR